MNLSPLLRQPLLLLFCLMLVGGSATARAEAQEPARLVQQVFDDSLQALQERHAAIAADPHAAYALLEELLAPHIDFPRIGRLVLARHWSDASPAQRERFVVAFREALLAGYADQLSRHSERVLAAIELGPPELRLLPPEAPDARGQVTLPARLRVPGSELALAFRLQRQGDRWRVFDVLVEELSLVMHYRERYQALLEEHTLDELIVRLERRGRPSRAE